MYTFLSCPLQTNQYLSLSLLMLSVFFLSTFEQHFIYESHVYALFGQSFAGKLMCILISRFIILIVLLNALALYRCAFNHNKTSNIKFWGVTRFLGSLKISPCEERRLKDTQNLKCEDRSFKFA